MQDVLYKNQGFKSPRRVWFSGSTALSKGTGVCYDHDFADTDFPATEAHGLRGNIVAVPGATNNLSFAGIVAQSYAAKTGGQYIYIHEPGSLCLVRGNAAAVVIGEKSFVHCIAGGDDAGKFKPLAGLGILGRGAARVLQTDATGAMYLVQLLDGPESGLVEDIALALTGGAITPMIGGVTVVDGDKDLSANATCTLANGTFIGQRKVFKLTAAIATSDLVVTVTAGVQLDGTTALATATLDGAGDLSVLEWLGDKWKLIHNTGTALA